MAPDEHADAQLPTARKLCTAHFEHVDMINIHLLCLHKKTKQIDAAKWQVVCVVR